MQKRTALTSEWSGITGDSQTAMQKSDAKSAMSLHRAIYLMQRPALSVGMRLLVTAGLIRVERQGLSRTYFRALKGDSVQKISQHSLRVTTPMRFGIHFWRSTSPAATAALRGRRWPGPLTRSIAGMAAMKLLIEQ